MNEEIVRSCYRVLLGREPENEDVIRSAAQLGGVEPILQSFFDSSEFRHRQRNLIKGVYDLLQVPRLPLVETTLDRSHTTPQDLLSRFESLGDTCEFGFVQRHFGLEPISLLRWAGTPLDGLTRALIADFRGFFAYESLSSAKGLLKDETYGISFHSELTVGSRSGEGSSSNSLVTAPHAVRTTYRREYARITFLLRIFRETLAQRHKIYIYKCNYGISPAQMMQLKSSLDLYGPQRLLCVSPAAQELPAGQVHLLASGLKLAGIGRLAPYERQEDIDPGAWLAVCEAAVGTDWGQGGKPSVGPTSYQPMIETYGAVLSDRALATAVYTALYHALLLREPDDDGLLGHVEDAVNNARTLEDAVTRITSSTEYQLLVRNQVGKAAGANVRPPPV